MQKNAKQLANQINKALNEMGLPIHHSERATMLSKMLGIAKQQARSLLEGHILPDNILLKKISDELDIDIKSYLHKE